MAIRITRPHRAHRLAPTRKGNLAARHHRDQPVNETQAGEKDGSRVIVHRPVTALTANPRNARTHDDKQVAQIGASMRQFGFTNPILIDDKGMVLAGHARLAAARELGQNTVPTITLAGLSK